ncbi:MAG TPA: DsrH/TusB family sulfur metabolism protein [Rheinheimera sp.]|uniref:DsrH/TusB family sulfur metabolism protein n=1 Tax=Rheinheimera sp. TaxID=1869214 RepID=UPI002F9278C8
MKLISLITPDVNLDALSRICQPEDAILLRQDAVYLCLSPQRSWPVKQLYALQTDVAIRQLQLPDSIHAVSATQWIDLCSKATQNILWQK